MPCEAQLYNLGYERRETEPQPCGEKTEWIIRPFRPMRSRSEVYLDNPTKSCTEHLGNIIEKLSKEFPTIFFEIRKAGMFD